VISADVRVFPVELDQPAPVVARLDALLAVEERDAPARTRVARAATRLVLADALGIAPADVVISRRCEHCGHPTHGRPVLVAERRLSFSLSHSGAYAVLACAEGEMRIGVDVEEVRPRARLAALAARVLNDEDQAAWRAITDPDEQLRVFLTFWTAKEAYLKALGIGIATRLRDVPAGVEGWFAGALELGPDRIGALAVDRAVGRVRYVAPGPLVTSSGGTAR